MKIDVLEKKGDVLKLEITDANTKLVNALRRTVIAEVPTFSVVDAMVYENTSAMFDEYVIHRLGLIPLKTDYDYKMPGQCCGGKCASCSVTLSLNEQGPKTVYSGDLKSSDSRVKPVSDTVPIIKLTKGEVLRLEARAVLGKGEDHARWTPAVAAYTHKQNVELAKAGDEVSRCTDACPKHLAKAKKGGLEEAEVIRCEECKPCEGKIGSNTIKFVDDNEAFIFTIESHGSLKPKDILLKAIDTLIERLEYPASELK